jgi:hypothetical protein
MLNSYFWFYRSAWIACTIIDGTWIEGDSFPTWKQADDASRLLTVNAVSILTPVPAGVPSPPPSGTGLFSIIAGLWCALRWCALPRRILLACD